MKADELCQLTDYTIQMANDDLADYVPYQGIQFRPVEVIQNYHHYCQALWSAGTNTALADEIKAQTMMDGTRIFEMQKVRDVLEGNTKLDPLRLCSAMVVPGGDHLTPSTSTTHR